MASTTTYKDLTVQSTTPTGAAGARIDSNFKKLADRCYGVKSADTQNSYNYANAGYSVVVGGYNSITNYGAYYSVCIGGCSNHTRKEGGVAMGYNARNNEAYSLALASSTDTTLPGQMGFKTMFKPASSTDVALLQVGTGVPTLVTVDGIIQYGDTPHFFKKTLSIYNGAITKQEYLFKSWESPTVQDSVVYFTVRNGYLYGNNNDSHVYFGLQWTQFGNDVYYDGATSGGYSY